LRRPATGGGRVGRHHCGCDNEGGSSQAVDHRFGQHGLLSSQFRRDRHYRQRPRATHITANGHALAYVYFEDEPGRRSTAHLMTRDEARRIAAHITKLSGLGH
jgi:hypothetical protein